MSTTTLSRHFGLGLENTKRPLRGPVELLIHLFPTCQKREKFDRLITRYKMLPLQVQQSDGNRPARDIIEEMMQKAEEQQPSWSEIETVDRALLTMLPSEDLKRYAWSLRNEYQRATTLVASDESLQKAYNNSKPADPEKSGEAELRADLLTLQAQLHELYANRRLQLRARNAIAFWTVLLFVIAVIFTIKLDQILGLETMVFDIMGVGMLGGMFSTLLRVQKFRLGGIRASCSLAEAGNQIGVILAPAIGGFGAVVLFVVLVAGFFKCSLFPELPSTLIESGTDCLEAIFKMQLTSPAETAKLYLVCFLAGFSERLVPDVMSRLAALGAKEK